MFFNSLQFLIFFAVIFLLYYGVVPDRHRWLLLLVGSCYFYMAYIPKFILVLFALITVDYFLGLKVSKTSGKTRKFLLVLSIVVNIGTLFFFRYFNFFNENISYIAQLIHWNYPLVLLQIALPLGLSFHVFQSLSYVIEVYRGKQMPERNYGIYALYVMFFPQLVAGPIERPMHMLHQFYEPHSFDATKVRRGLEMMLWGFFKKLIIADRAGQIVDHVYGNIAGSNGFVVGVAAVLFAYQLYCDFSGYSDIAVGSALVFGYDLTRNFDRPFSARSIAELWRRWHISLSSWLRDYFYYPLTFTGKKVTKLRVYTSLFVTFTLIGLWHGPNWTYVIFGALQGIYTVFSSASAAWRKRFLAMITLDQHNIVHHFIQTVTTLILFGASLVFFRAASVREAGQIFARMGNAIAHPLQGFTGWGSFFSYENFGVQTQVIIMLVVTIAFLEWVQYLQAKKGNIFILETSRRYLRWGVYYGLVFATLLLGYFGAEPFIYFKF